MTHVNMPAITLANVYHTHNYCSHFAHCVVIHKQQVLKYLKCIQPIYGYSIETECTWKVLEQSSASQAQNHQLKIFHLSTRQHQLACQSPVVRLAIQTTCLACHLLPSTCLQNVGRTFNGLEKLTIRIHLMAHRIFTTVKVNMNKACA